MNALVVARRALLFWAVAAAAAAGASDLRGEAPGVVAGHSSPSLQQVGNHSAGSQGATVWTVVLPTVLTAWYLHFFGI